MRRPLALTFVLRDGLAGTGFIQLFTVDLRADGSARVTSGEDDRRHPIPVPAAVAVDGAAASMVLDDASFAAGRPSPMSRSERPRGHFAFMASSTAPTGPRDAVRDDLGTWSYPDGVRLGG